MNQAGVRTRGHPCGVQAMQYESSERGQEVTQCDNCVQRVQAWGHSPHKVTSLSCWQHGWCLVTGMWMDQSESLCFASKRQITYESLEAGSSFRAKSGQLLCQQLSSRQTRCERDAARVHNAPEFDPSWQDGLLRMAVCCKRTRPHLRKTHSRVPHPHTLRCGAVAAAPERWHTRGCVNPTAVQRCSASHR